MTTIASTVPEPSDTSSEVKAPAPVRVLVVDDDADICRTYRDVLNSHGFTVAMARNGREALQILMQQSIDVLVVDLRMEEMDGIVFLQEALRVWPWLGVVIVSAYISRDVPRRAARLGVDRILEKPVDIDTFVSNIEAAAREKQALKDKLPRRDALSLMREHLKLLANVSRRSLGGDALSATMKDLGLAVAEMIPCDVVGIFVEEERGAPTLITVPRTRVSAGFIDALKRDMLDRFKALSGRRIDAARMRVHAEGSTSDSSTAPSAIGHALSVPLLIDNDVKGLLTLATIAPDGFTPTDVSLLYHTANHISSIFTALRHMHTLATRDPLTNIFNRVRLEEELERAWLISRRYGHPMGIVVIDIDNFKSINDAFGHAVGDQVIREFAQVLMTASRSTDLVARYGGDEFVAVLPKAAESDALAFGERLLADVRQHVFCDASHNLAATVSIGIATSDNPTQPESGAVLLEQADRALYAAKRAGRDRMSLWPGPATTAHDTSSNAVKPYVGGMGASGRARILVVEDEEAIRQLVTIMLERQKHTVECHGTASDAMESLRRHPGAFDILLTDIGLPDKSGIELMHEVANEDDSIVRMVMTGHATIDNAIECLREGAYDFIRKPIERQYLVAQVRRAMEYRMLKIENDRYQAHLETMVRERSAKLSASLREVQAAHEFTLDALVRMLDAREHHTAKHSKRVRELTLRLAREMGLDTSAQEIVARGAFLHDIGKIAVPDGILLKPGPLDDTEWARMRIHSQTGYDILKSSPFLRETAKIVLQHHEHWDGSGYPEGRRGEAIVLGARIFAVVDAYDAMRGNRVYREAISSPAAVDEIVACAGTQFDPKVVAAFQRCVDDLEAIVVASAEPPAAIGD